MRIKQLLVPVLLGTIFLLGCNKNTVTLSSTNAKGEVPQLGNLYFRFSQSLVKDSMVNAWDSTDYIHFEPSIKGRFRWQSPDELVFSPAQPLDPATSYKASVNNAVLKYSAYNDVKNGEDLQFNTPNLLLDNAQVTWVGESNTSAVPELNLWFNYGVDPALLKDKLKLQLDGQDLAYSVISASAGNQLTLRLTGVKPQDKEFEVKMSIDKGLKPEKGSNSTTDPITSVLSIPSPYVLAIQNMETEHDGTEGVIHFSTSQQVDPTTIRAFLKFEPDLAYTIDQADNGFILRSSSFDVEKSYTIAIAKGLRGRLGGTLREDYDGSVAFGELEAGISFTNSKAVYLSGKGGKNLEIRITNVPKIKVIISKIYENNLLSSQRDGYYPQESGEDQSGEYEDDTHSYMDATLGDVIYEKEIDTRSLPKSGGGRLLNFSQFEDRLPEFKGVYHVMIRSVQDYWVRDSRFISVSDLGLIAKQGADKIYVFTQSIKTAVPVAGVNFTLYGANNQLLGSGASNADGVAEIAYSKKEFSGFRPAMVIAKTADDFNFLPFNNTGVNTSRFDVGGKRSNPSGLDAFVYAERDTYRPGEQVNFSAVVRDKQWKSPGDMPLKIRMLMPNGKELASMRKTLNAEGSVEGSVPIATSAITGTYNLEVYTSNDVLLSSKPFYIEEFVPDRIKVDAKLDKPSARPGESATLAVAATNFFGPPAANRKYETEIQVKQKQFAPAQFTDYNFGLANENSFFDKVLREGKTTEAGAATETYEIPADYGNRGVLQANFYTTVFDETGRPVSRAASLDVFTQDVFFGLKNNGDYYYPLNQPANFQLAAVNREGNGVSAKAKVEVIKHEYRTVLSKSGSYFRYESQQQDKVVSTNEVSINSKGSQTFVPRSPGDYEVRVYVPGSTTYISQSFYSYGSWGGDNTSFEVNPEGSIDIDIAKKTYATGETVKALFKTPFSGKMLVTVETDHLITWQHVEVSNRSASVDLKVTADYLPNAYITATLIKPHEVSDIPLTVAHGFKNISVEEKGRKMDVAIDAKKSVRSKTKQKISVKAAPGSYVTLSAVDNGVLQISDFKTPDPYDYFYQKKALQVNAYDLYPLLFAEVRPKLSSTGGDGELSMEKRVNPMPAKRIKVVSYWSGIKKANGSGVADFDVDVPAFSGELRLMAVAYKGQNFGGNATTMTVADPVVISTALPRFLSPGDTVNIPVTLSNTTAKAASLTANVKTEGPVALLGTSSVPVTVNANGEARVVFNLVASNTLGVGKIHVEVNGLGEKFEDVTEISVRPPSTLQKVTGSGSVNGGGSTKVSIGGNDFLPGSLDYQLIVGRSPMAELGEQLRYLIQYPYGCTEQTISAAFPQLYYGDLADLVQSGASAMNKTNANNNILEAIRKIKLRQLYTGALTLWDGEGKEDWWSSIYGAHFLLEARKAGFDVDNSLLETLLNYLNNKLRNRETIAYYYNRDQQKKIAPKEVAYTLYVLALAGRSNVPAMNYYKAKPELLALDSRYLLSAAYATAGDRKSFQAMLPPKFAGEESVAQTGGSYYSDLRDESISLDALLEVDPGNRQIPEMVAHVNAKLKQRGWLSTQERAFSFLALGKFARTANNSTATAEIRVNGKTVAKVDGGSWKGDMKALGGQNVEIVTGGTGRIYYSWQAEGISSTGAYKEEDNYMKARRKFFDRNGKQLMGNTFKQNDLVIVALTLEKAYSGDIENIVLTDLIPAGFEIENPRTKEIPGMDWIKDAATPTALDVRDDRINLFVDLVSSKQTYYYAVRAVSPGNYKMGPVSADAMYNGEYHSYNGGGVIRIVP